MTAPKPTSVRTETERSAALDEYRAEHQAAVERMAEQRKSRLSAAALLKIKEWRAVSFPSFTT